MHINTYLYQKVDYCLLYSIRKEPILAFNMKLFLPELRWQENVLVRFWVFGRRVDRLTVRSRNSCLYHMIDYFGMIYELRAMRTLIICMFMFPMLNITLGAFRYLRKGSTRMQSSSENQPTKNLQSMKIPR